MAETDTGGIRWSAGSRATFGGAGGVLVGVALGAGAAAATGYVNGSLEFGRDAFVLALWLALAYAVPCSAVAAVAAALAGADSRWTRMRLASVGAASSALAFAGYYAGNAVVASQVWLTPGNPRRVQAALAVAAASVLPAIALLRRPFGRRLVARAGAAVLALATLAGALALLRAALPARASTVFAAATSRLPAASSQRRVVLLGIDGADWRRIDPLLAQGKLPSFRRLLERGLCAPLRTSRPTWSPIVWATIATGAVQARHGIRDFTELRIPGLARGLQRARPKLGEPALLPPGLGLGPLGWFLLDAGWIEELPISSRQRRAKAVWDVLGERGATVGVVSWFASYPAEPVRGWMVSDGDPWHQVGVEMELGEQPDTDVGLTHPPELLDELARALPPIPDDERMEAHVEWRSSLYADLTPDDRERIQRDRELLPMAASIQGGDRFAASAGLWLWREKRPEFLAVYLRAVDNLSHRMREFTGVIDRTYEWTDGLLGEYLDALDERTVLIVVSDHGWDYEPSDPIGHNHAPDGILAIYGLGVDPLADLGATPTIFDVAPTVLALFGLPASEDMPGRALEPAFARTAEANGGAPATGFGLPRIATWGRHEPPAAENARAVRRRQAGGVDRLRALGYVE